MFCTNCGKHLEDSQASLCTGCGAPITGASASAVPDPFPDYFRENPEASGSASLRVPWMGGQVAWGLLFLIMGEVIILLVVAIILLDPAQFAWTSSLLMGLVILLIVWYLGLRRTRGSISLLGFRPTSIPAGRAILWAIGTLALSFGATILYGTIIEWLEWERFRPPKDYRQIVFEGPAVVLTLLALALWTPLTEELFFRGFVFAGLVHRFSVAGAIVISAMIFSAFHVVPGVLIPIFMTGLLLAWLYHRTGSLWPSIAAHAGQNAAALLLPIFAPSTPELSAIILPAV